jgi:hypothetical protein
LDAQYCIETAFWRYSDPPATRKIRESLVVEIYNKDSLLTELRYNYAGANFYKTLYDYDTGRNVITERDYDRLGNSLQIRKNTYNAHGKKMSMSFSTANKEGDHFMFKEEYYYNASGERQNIIRTSEGFREPQIVEYKTEMKDGNRIVTESTITKGEKKPAITIMIYNSHNDLIEHRSGNKRYRYEYVYTADGEWISRKVCKKEYKISAWQCTGESTRERKLIPAN